MDTKIFDIHTHIIYDTDDGSRSYEESLEMMRQASEVGIIAMVATPHYLIPKYETSSHHMTKKMAHLKAGLDKYHIPLRIFKGSEIMISNETIDALENEKCFTINDTEYLLFECPFYGQLNQLKDMVFELTLKGYKPIFAHPERYEFVQNDIDYLYELLDMGVYFQVSLPSIAGYYGKSVEKTVKKMIKKGLIHFIGTDIHRLGSRVLKIEKPLKYLKKHLSEDQYLDVCHRNGEKMIKGEAI